MYIVHITLFQNHDQNESEHFLSNSTGGSIKKMKDASLIKLPDMSEIFAIDSTDNRFDSRIMIDFIIIPNDFL